MFLGIGTTMAALQGGWIRRIPEHKTKAITELVCISTCQKEFNIVKECQT